MVEFSVVRIFVFKFVIFITARLSVNLSKLNSNNIHDTAYECNSVSELCSGDGGDGGVAWGDLEKRR